LFIDEMDNDLNGFIRAESRAGHYQIRLFNVENDHEGYLLLYGPSSKRRSIAARCS